MSMIENDPAILALKSRCATLETNGNKLEDENENTPTPPPPTMDLQVHRLRHLEYIPSPIVSMASKGNTAAVAREDGSFELVEVISPPSPPQAPPPRAAATRSSS